MPPSSHNLKGVRISCEGDIRFLGAKRFIPVDVSPSDPVLTAQISHSSEMVGVRVRVCKLPPHPTWRDSGVTGIYENAQVTRLFRAMDPEQDDFGFVLPYSDWDYPVGSVLVVRADGQDIRPQQVEALCFYSSDHTAEMFEESSEHLEFTGSNEERVKLAALFNPGDFRQFFAEYKAKKVLEDPSWATAVSPI